MATVELAAALPVLVLLLAVGLSALDAARMRISCLDAAREGARVAARADDAAGADAARRVAPPGSAIAISRDGGFVTVHVAARAAVLGARVSPIVVAASATATIEPQETAGVTARGAADGAPPPRANAPPPRAMQ